MTPQVEEALGHIVCRMHTEHLLEYFRLQDLRPYNPAKARAVLSRIGVLYVHMCAVAARSKSPAELRARLLRSGALPEVASIEWYYAGGRGYRDMSPPAWFGATASSTSSDHGDGRES